MSERSEHGETTQLRLLSALPARERSARKEREAFGPEWRLDERTRRAGRQGVAEARAILRRARPPEPKQSPAVRKAS